MASFMDDPVSGAANTAYGAADAAAASSTATTDAPMNGAMGEQEKVKTQLTQMSPQDLAEIIVSLATPEQLKTIIGPALSSMESSMSAETPEPSMAGAGATGGAY